MSNFVVDYDTSKLPPVNVVGRRLITKLAEVMAAVERIPKRGRNEFHKYDYATESDIVATVRAELASRHVMLLPAVLSITRESVGEKGSVLTTLEMEFTFLDGDTGECQSRRWLGCGSDKDDKGIYKAMTGGEKYFLLKTFLMPTGDDPEAEDVPKKAKGARPDPPATVVDAATGEEVPASATPPPPPGYVYLHDCVLKANGWYEARVKNDGGTGTTCYSTKLEKLGSVALQAFQNGVPVRLKGKPGKQAGDFYLDGIETWKPTARRPMAPFVPAGSDDEFIDEPPF